MSTIQIIAFIFASGFLFFGFLYFCGAFSPQLNIGSLLISSMNFLIGLGLIWFARRPIKTPLSTIKWILSIAAGILLVIAEVYIINAFANQIKVGSLIFGLVSVIAGFGLIWFSQRDGQTATSNPREPAQVEELPEIPKKRWKPALIVSLAVIAVGLCTVSILAVANFLNTTIPYEASGIGLKYPMTWKQLNPKEVSSPGEVIIALTPSKGNGFFKISQWKVAEQSMDGFTDGMDQTIQAHPEVMLINKQELTIGEEKAVSWNYAGPCPGYPDRNCKYLSIITTKNQSCYLITYVDDSAEYDRSRLTLLRILTSIQFLENVPTKILCSTHNALAMSKYSQAQKLSDQGKLEEAEKLYRAALDLDSDFCDAMDNLGVTLRRQEQVDEAISWYLKSLEVKPENQLALRNLGIAYRYKGNTGQAIQTFQKLMQVAPDEPESYYQLGIIYFNLKQYEKAITNLKTAEQLYAQVSAPEIIDAQYFLGSTYFMLRDYAKAKSYFLSIYDQKIGDQQINYALGICYLDSQPKDLELAKKYLLKAEQMGFRLPAELFIRLRAEFGEWPPR